MIRKLKSGEYRLYQEAVLAMPCCAPGILSLRAECSANLLCGVAGLRLRAVCLRFGSRFGLPALATGLSRTGSLRKKDPRTGKRKNLGTFKTRTAAEKHERAVQYFKRH